MPTELTTLPVRRLARGDLLACADLSEDRGWERDEHRWGLLLSAGTGYGIDAPDGKGLAASCVVTSYGSELAAVGVLLVAGRYERQGIGRRLMRHVIETTGDTPLSLFATESGKQLYEELGFVHKGPAVRVRGVFRPGPGGASPAVSTRAATAGDLPAILRLDAEVFGADRTHMITRLPAFADQLRVARDGDELIGYAAAWPSGRAQCVGPLVARDTETAQALIAGIAANVVAPLRLDVDARHTALLDWTARSGLEQTGSTLMMAYRTADFPGDWTRRFAPLTVAAG
ncbi:GNAT family N-acetyltransferase [Streptomyces sp. NPDC050504]|uniref:GNAT family N-acetyltransferase n=1 Tax=Streptomyces sp. NPDC050504 TaxID=3365618 RepID=UPI0037A8CF54